MNVESEMSRQLNHVDIAEYAKRFVLDRLAGFEKDMQICLSAAPRRDGHGNTYAHFPALGACCGIIEYLTALHHGNINIGWQQVAMWSHQYLPQPDYDEYMVRILIAFFRNTVNHRGIASGVWIDKDQGRGNGRRLTWKIYASARRPACQVIEENHVLVNDPPWPCPYTHRVHIYLKALQVDIRKAAKSFSNDLANDSRSLKKFEQVMNQIYPRAQRLNTSP